MKIILISKSKFKIFVDQLYVNLKEIFPDLEFQLYLEENDLSYAEKITKKSKEVVKDKKNNRLILIDEVGSLGFMVSAKTKGMITAQCSNQHSAHMTREHNGALGLSLGVQILSLNLATEIVELFLRTSFAAGRHMVRIDMLDKLG